MFFLEKGNHHIILHNWNLEKFFLRISEEQKTPAPTNSLVLEHFLLPFIILLGGIIISFIIFILELAKHSSKTTNIDLNKIGSSDLETNGRGI